MATKRVYGSKGFYYKDMGPDHLGDSSLENVFMEQKRRVDAMSTTEIKAERKTLQKLLWDRDSKVDPRMKPVYHKVLRHVIRRDMAGGPISPDAPADAGPKSPGYDMRIGGHLGEPSVVGTGHVNINDIDFRGDEKTRQAAEKILTRNRKWREDQARKKQEMKVEDALTFYHQQLRFQKANCGIGPYGPNPYDEAKKDVEKQYGKKMAETVAGGDQ